MTSEVTGSPPDFHRTALQIAEQLDEYAIVASKRIECLDLRGAFLAGDLAVELREMANRFAEWPRLGTDVVAAERPGLLARLVQIRGTTNELCAKNPGFARRR